MPVRPAPARFTTAMLKRCHLYRAIHTTRAYRQWAVSDPVTDRKSTFQGRAITIKDSEDAEAKVTELIRGNKKISKATHNITAWRTNTEDRFIDDGEAPGGERILGLLQKADIKNVLVVVTRWYGGVQLGGARFKHIGRCAHDALKEGKFMR